MNFHGRYNLRIVIAFHIVAVFLIRAPDLSWIPQFKQVNVQSTRDVKFVFFRSRILKAKILIKFELCLYICGEA